MVGDIQNGTAPLRWLKTTGFYVAHVLTSTVVVFLVSVFLGEGIEHFINPQALDKLIAPPFPADLTVGLLLGFFVNRYLQSKSAKWAWVVPAAWLAFYFPDYIRTQQGWFGAISYMFGTNCGDCVEQIMTTGPLCGSIAYSLGAWAVMKRPFNSEVRSKGRRESR